MMEILPGVIAQRVERQPAFGPRLVEGMAEHRPFRHFRVDCRGYGGVWSCGLPEVDFERRDNSRLAAADKSDQGERRQLAVQPRRKLARCPIRRPRQRVRSPPRGSASPGGRAWARRDQLELGRADDVDPPVGAILEAQDLLAGDQPVLDDPVERAADEFVRPLRPHAGGDPHLAVAAPGRDAVFERLDGPQPNATLVIWSCGTLASGGSAADFESLSGRARRARQDRGS